MLAHHHDVTLVILSVATAILGSYTALDLFRHVRGQAGVQARWLAAAAAAMGLSIWSMHFVAMLAFDLGIAVCYDVGLTLISLLVAVAVTAVAFVAAARSNPRPARILAAGLVMGLGICAMHYIGMAAMRLPARLSYDRALVALSVLIAVGASTVALVLALKNRRLGWRVAGAIALGLAIAGMHYVAMLAATFTPLAGEPSASEGIGSRGLALNVTAATLFILLLGLATARFDRRFGASEARFRSLVTNMRGIAFRRASPGRGELGYEQDMAQLYGLDAKRITGAVDEDGQLSMTRWYRAVHPEDRAAYSTAERGHVERHQPFALDYRIIHPATGKVRWIHEVAWVAEDPATGRLWFDSYMLDRTEQKCVEASLRESEERNRRLVETAPVAILIYADWRCTYANPRAVRLLGGRSPEDLVGRHIVDLVQGDVFETMRRDLAACPHSSGEALTWELSCTRCDGSQFPASASAVTITQHKQPTVQLVLVDLTERKQAEAAQALLIDELNHRVKNILATIDAMIGFTVEGAGSAEELGATLAGRITAMARTHDLLTSGRWEGAELSELLERELQPYAVAEQVRVAGARLLLKPKAALSLSLVVHELATNALKHGALSVPEGRIEVSWSVDRTAERQTWRLVWQESGGPVATAPRRRGFGTTLIERAAARDLGGKARLRFAPPGFCCELECPLTPIVTEEALPLRPTGGDDGDAVDAEEVLAGTRVLVVEDEMLLTMVIETALGQAGAEPVGPASTLAEAVSLAQAERLDAAVLDVNLNDEAVFPVADFLRERGVPFIFATGYAAEAAIPPRHRDIPRLPKPYRSDQLRRVLAQALTRHRYASRAAGLPARPDQARSGLP
jgi:PAS domain S-box-containing protein